jgi:NADH-quinone oxidoreductase subunit J
LETYFFYFFAAAVLFTSVLAVTSRRILRAAVYLLFTLAATSAFYFAVSYFFLAAVQLIVYAGGIVVLIIFSILLTSHLNARIENPGILKMAFSAILGLGGIVLSVYVFMSYNFSRPLEMGSDELTVDTIGKKLMNYGEGGYVLPFEVISILLLAAMIGAIVVAKRTKPEKDA